MNVEEFRKRLRIDKHGLDDCIEEQPVVFDRVAQQTATTIALRDAKKLELEKTYARISMGYRREFSKQGKKITEEFLRQTVLTDEEYDSVQQDYLTYKDEADQWIALKEAFQQRGYMLRDLANLYVAGYFSDITVRGQVPEETSTSLRRKQLSERRRTIIGKSDG